MGVFMKFKTAVLLLMVLCTGCSKVGFQGGAEKADASLGASNGDDVPAADPVDPLPLPSQPQPGSEVVNPPPAPSNPNDYNKPFSGACEIFKDVQFPLVIPASAPTVIVDNSVSAVYTLKVAKEVRIVKTNGHTVVVEAADRITEIHRPGGTTQVSANTIDYIHDTSGYICINAVKIGRIVKPAGGTRIIASEIEEISQASGQIHIYGAVIKTLMLNGGTVCLHEGAQVLTTVGSAGTVGKCM